MMDVRELSERDYLLLSRLRIKPRWRKDWLPGDLPRLEELETMYFVEFRDRKWHLAPRGEWSLEQRELRR